MANLLVGAGAACWLVVVALAFLRLKLALGTLLCLGCLLTIAAALSGLPDGLDNVALPVGMAGEAVNFQLKPEALWLLGFGLFPALFACGLAAPRKRSEAGWALGAALSLLGALGVSGFSEGAAFLIAWEAMSFGGAAMILSENQGSGRPVLFMLALLETGLILLLLAILVLGGLASGLDFGRFPSVAQDLSAHWRFALTMLLLLGFGAKLGLLPFYEWYPGAYASASGATGVIMSGVVLNAAYFALSQSLVEWLPHPNSGQGIIIVAWGTLTAVLAILYAFQQEDWRALLSFSSVENAAIAVVCLGTSILFRAGGQTALASLAWTVALIHLAGHSLAKGTMFLVADAVYRHDGSYLVRQSGLLKGSAWPLGAGALIAAMSLSAMPPQAGFVSEWYVFQSIFQGFHLGSLSDRLTLAIAGAGLALSVAVAFATFAKVFGIGLLGHNGRTGAIKPVRETIAVGLIALGLLLFVIGMPLWIQALDQATYQQFAVHTPAEMRVGLILVPGTGTPIAPDRSFAFISPTLLFVAFPCLAIVPAALLVFLKRQPIRRAPVWYGGGRQDPVKSTTTALAFSNALRVFYAFVYRPTSTMARETVGNRYVVRRLTFNHMVAPIFGPYLFAPAVRIVRRIADKIARLQSGHLNFYLALIGGLLVLILALVLV